MNDDNSKEVDSSKYLLDRLLKWVPPTATLISTIASVLAPLSLIWKFIVISTILWGLCYYLRFGRKAPILVGIKSGPYIYSERIRFGAFLGLVGIPSIVIGAFVSPIIFPPEKESLAKIIPTASPFTIDRMDDLSSWASSFCDKKCGDLYGNSSLDISLVPGKTNNGIEVLYDLKNSGWVLITRSIDPSILSGTTGISFSYRGSGAPNTIELKLLYPDSTTFGSSWHRATDTSDNWISLEALYSDFTCWWPTDQCEKYGNNLSLTAVKIIEFGISNKPGVSDKAGLGKVVFDDVVGIPP